MALNPKDYSYHGKLGIENAFWADLERERHRGKDFYLPSRALRKDWPDVLENYNVTNILYDLRVVGLTQEVTSEMCEELRVRRLKYMVKSLGDSKENQLPTLQSISPEEWLQSERMRILARQSAGEMLRSFGKDIPEEQLTDFEERVLQWHRGYGFLVDYQDTKGFFFPVPRDDSALKYEVVREFLFHLPYSSFPGVILSIGHEPNSNRAIWGFRRDFATSWPKEFPEDFVENMNGLINDLESFLKTSLSNQTLY